MPEMPDFEDIMQMAQNAQNELQRAQDTLDKVEVEGAQVAAWSRSARLPRAGSSASTSTKACWRLPKRQCSRTSSRPRINDARGKADAAAATEMEKMQSSLQMPPGFKLPF